ncbi:hypothetical protein [Mycobacteroides abscessus]|uniref:hypothetical protein n=1 Tax=Mycobacteroides abscessus TaxID=36809 RepID=UPI00031509AD|nr:hypothetical protein [Mycobacteroides abscessus]
MTVQLDPTFSDDVALAVSAEPEPPVNVTLPSGGLVAEPWKRSPDDQGWFRRWHGRTFAVPGARRDLAVRCGGIQIVEDSGVTAFVRTVDVTPETGLVTTEGAAQLATALAEAAQYSESLETVDKQ